ncbi:MAG: hypothetical protein CMJ74_07410 [Planctomycetaceae bacterium]|nr:hypothetical protein [Planctomycetaceae bacterium]|tara:strand:+ start:1881 stop:2552 length:672 start_codon:yes stop_codon:yes gene_type:complete
MQKLNKIRSIITAAVFFLGVVDCISAAEQQDNGWVPLFDGTTLNGWEQKNGTAHYRIEDGAIVGKTTDGSPNSFLCTTKDYADFELEFEVKCDPRLNSGVQIRSKSKSDSGRVNGPQIEIAATESGGLSGYVYGEATGRGWLTPEQDRDRHSHFDDDSWNRYRVVVRGPQIETWINGNKITTLVDEDAAVSHPEGFIGLQVHGIGRGQGPYEVRWRNIQIKPL